MLATTALSLRSINTLDKIVLETIYNGNDRVRQNIPQVTRTGVHPNSIQLKRLNRNEQIIIRNGEFWWHSPPYGCIWDPSKRLRGRKPLSRQFGHRLAVVVQSTSHSSQFVLHSFELNGHWAPTIMSHNQVFHKRTDSIMVTGQSISASENRYRVKHIEDEVDTHVFWKKETTLYLTLSPLYGFFFTAYPVSYWNEIRVRVKIRYVLQIHREP